MKSPLCNRPIKETRQRERLSHVKQCGPTSRRANAKYVWREEYDAYLKTHYFGGLNRRFRVLNLMVRMTGAPRWYIQRRARSLGLTFPMDRRPWTRAEVEFPGANGRAPVIGHDCKEVEAAGKLGH